VTCGILESMRATLAYELGDIKFSSMQPRTAVRPHTGPNNSSIRVHLPLSGLDAASITLAGERRGWKAGELLIVDVRHPDLRE